MSEDRLDLRQQHLRRPPRRLLQADLPVSGRRHLFVPFPGRQLLRQDWRRLRRHAGLRGGVPGARLDLRKQHLPGPGGLLSACPMQIGKRRYLLWRHQRLLRRNHELQPRLPDGFYLPRPPVRVWSRLRQNPLHATGRRSLLRHHRRWLRRDSRLSGELPQWRPVRRGAYLRHGRRWRARAATTGAHPATVGHLACTNAAPGAGPPSTVAGSAAAAASSHPATVLISGYREPRIPWACR